MYLGSIDDQVWEVTENDYAIIDPDDPTNQDKINKQCNTMSLNTIYNAIDSKVFEQIKDCERANDVWRRLKVTYEGTPAVKSTKLICRFLNRLFTPSSHIRTFLVVSEP